MIAIFNVQAFQLTSREEVLYTCAKVAAAISQYYNEGYINEVNHFVHLATEKYGAQIDNEKVVDSALSQGFMLFEELTSQSGYADKQALNYSLNFYHKVITKGLGISCMLYLK